MGQGERSELAGIRRAAAEWAVRLSDPSCTPADHAAFEAWRAQSPHHEVAYEQEAAAWEKLDRLRALGAGSSEIDLDVLAPKKPAFAPAQAFKIAAGLILAIVTLVGGSMVLSAPPAYATALGERRSVVLEDGSRIELNTDSKVIVRFRSDVREVTLERGEAVFQIVDDARPFVIVADDARLTARRSEVAVRLRAEGPVVQVSGGSVALNSTGLAQKVDLSAGAELTYNAEGAQVHSVSLEDINRTLAWRQGSIALDGRSLGQAVEEFNRYNKQKLVLTDKQLSTLRLGGYFGTGDIEEFSSALERTFPVTATKSENGDIILGSKT